MKKSTQIYGIGMLYRVHGYIQRYRVLHNRFRSFFFLFLLSITGFGNDTAATDVVYFTKRTLTSHQRVEMNASKRIKAFHIAFKAAVNVLNATATYQNIGTAPIHRSFEKNFQRFSSLYSIHFDGTVRWHAAVRSFVCSFARCMTRSRTLHSFVFMLPLSVSQSVRPDIIRFIRHKDTFMWMENCIPCSPQCFGVSLFASHRGMFVQYG